MRRRTIKLLALLSLCMKGSLEEIIDRIHELAWDHDLYVAPGELTLITKTVVIEDDGENDTFEGFQYYLSIQDIQSITENLQAQINKPNRNQILAAIKYYYANDAYFQVKG